jgi:hypothetical protein
MHHQLSLLCYHIPTGFKPFVLPHGNSKSKVPFYPTWPSTMNSIKQELKQKHGPKEVVSLVSKKSGSMLEVRAPGQLARSELQV